MPIPMEMPASFLQAVIDGRVARYGCVLKDVLSGRIVGHLKEVGQAAVLLSGAPVSPIGTAASVVAQAGQWLDSHVQLKAIRQTLEHLQLVTTAGALASVAGLGVSVAGFALVLRRLERLE